MPKPLFRYLILILTAAACAAVLALSVSPVSRSAIGTRPSFGASRMAIEHAARLHAAVHILVFGLLAVVVWFGLSFVSSHSFVKGIGISAVLLLGFGTEYLQHIAYHNPLEVSDVITNLLSSTTMFAMLAVLSRYRRPSAEVKLKPKGVGYVMGDNN